MDKTTVHNLIIVDASGSMSGIYDQALAGINETIKTIGVVRKNDPNVEQKLTLLSFADGGERLQYMYRTNVLRTCIRWSRTIMCCAAQQHFTML